MSIRLPAVLALLVTMAALASMDARASDDTAPEVAKARFINLVASVKGASLFPLKNPGVVTLGTLAINSRVDFAISAFTTNGNGGTGGALTYSWNWGDGTPPGSGPFPNHTYVVPGTYSVIVTTTEAGNPTPNVATVTATITDAIKSIKLLTNENWGHSGGDSLSLNGVVHIPTNQSFAGQLAFFDIGGIQLSFVLNDKGKAALTSNANVVIDPVAGTSSTSIVNCKAVLNMTPRKKSSFLAFSDVPFVLKVKNAAFSPALADEFVTNRDANRDAVRITAKFTLFGILFQTGVNQVYTSKHGNMGHTR